MADTSRKFSYYRNLSPAQKAIYDQSDRATSVTLPHTDKLREHVAVLERALTLGTQPIVEKAAQRMVDALCFVLAVPRTQVKVLAKRPSRSWGELHGLYETERGTTPTLTVWMRTAKRKDIVKFRTFLRTLIHEFVHHLDFEHFKFRDSFHTEGFYKRESSMMKQLLGE